MSVLDKILPSIGSFLTSKGLDSALQIAEMLPITAAPATILETVKNAVTGTAKSPNPQFAALPAADQQQFIDMYQAESTRIQQEADAAEKEKEAQLKDDADARAMNIAIQQSTVTSTLSKVVPYCIAILVTLIWCAFSLYLGVRLAGLITSDKADLTGVLSIYATVTAVFMNVLNHFFGSTQASQAKDATISQMAKNAA